MFEDTGGPETRLWIFVGESETRLGSRGPEPVYVHVFVLDDDGLLSTHRFRGPISFDTRHFTVFREDGIYAIHALPHDEGRLLHLTETGFEAVPDKQAKRLMSEAKELAPHGAVLSHGEWADTQAVHTSFLHLSKRNKFIRISRKGFATVTVDRMHSDATGYIISPGFADDSHVYKRLSVTHPNQNKEMILLNLEDEANTTGRLNGPESR